MTKKEWKKIQEKTLLGQMKIIRQAVIKLNVQIYRALGFKMRKWKNNI